MVKDDGIPVYEGPMVTVLGTSFAKQGFIEVFPRIDLGCHRTGNGRFLLSKSHPVGIQNKEKHPPRRESSDMPITHRTILWKREVR